MLLPYQAKDILDQPFRVGWLGHKAVDAQINGPIDMFLDRKSGQNQQGTLSRVQVTSEYFAGIQPAFAKQVKVEICDFDRLVKNVSNCEL